MITTTALPATRWREPGDVQAILTLPPAGILIGQDGDRAPMMLPAIGPQITRIGVIGGRWIASMLAFRLLGVGCRLTVATADPAQWRPLLAAAGPSAVVGVGVGGWPPPCDNAATRPHLLVTDLPTPPGVGVGNQPFCTVVHVAREVPLDSPYWAAVACVVLEGRGHGAALAQVLGREDAHRVDTLAPRQLGVLDRNRVAAASVVLTGTERTLLFGV